jgi:hypothetical protein
MAVATRGTASNYLQRAPSPSGLVDVVDLILDKGLVIDAYIRVSVIGIETYLRFAEAVNRLDLTETELAGLPELQEKGSEKMTEGAIEGAEEEFLPGDSGSTLRTAAKAVAAAAATGAAAVVAKELAQRAGDHDEDKD